MRPFLQQINIDLPSLSQALVTPEKFQHILRVLNTNIDGKTKIMFGLTCIKVRYYAVLGLVYHCVHVSGCREALCQLGVQES